MYSSAIAAHSAYGFQQCVSHESHGLHKASVAAARHGCSKRPAPALTGECVRGQAERTYGLQEA